MSCGLLCEHGLATGPNGCDLCACYEPPDDSCAVDSECVLGVDYTDCCSCPAGYTPSRIAAEPCVVFHDEAPPAGCTRDPSCDGTACRCAPVLRAICQGGACIASETCAAGDVAHFGHCEPGCATHTDCVSAADYGSCCGSCEPHHAAFVAADRCFAETQAESQCSPGSCDGLGCPSPPTDCRTFGQAVVCMATGECSYADSGGGCPVGFHDVDSRCVAN
jgi:hypothetical protein